MQDNSIKELRQAISLMVRQRDRLVQSLSRDNQQMASLNAKIKASGDRFEQVSKRVEDIEMTLEKYDDTINESEMTFKKVSCS
jgi:septal ring factor EnvC (AmiA/AmiB activator)